MEAGMLRHKLLIQETTDSLDAGGGATESWATITDGTCWGRIQVLRGREFWEAQQMQEQVTHRITIRYRGGVESGQRVLFGARAFNIRSVQNVEERNIQLTLLCEETDPVHDPA